MKDSNAPAMERFERAAPNELWQMDGKGEYRVSDGTCYPLSILDDHSRYAVGLYRLAGVHGRAASIRVWCMTFERYGVPEAMLMDHGSVWWGTTNGYGLTWLSVRLIEQGIRLCYGRVHHPQTQGKVERFHRTLDEAIRHRGKPQQMAEWPQSAGGISADLQRATAARSAGDEAAGGTVSREYASLSGGSRASGNIPQGAWCGG